MVDQNDGDGDESEDEPLHTEQPVKKMSKTSSDEDALAKQIQDIANKYSPGKCVYLLNHTFFTHSLALLICFAMQICWRRSSNRP